MSKATNENYIIRIKSYIDQFDSEGNIKEEDRDHIELMTRGNLVKKGGAFISPTKRPRPLALRAAPPPSRSPRTAAGWLCSGLAVPTVSCSLSGSGATSATTRPKSAP